MTYPGLFSHYTLSGKDWLRSIKPEDRAAFSYIGRKEAEHGSLGGKALVKKRGKAHMKSIGRRGAIASNSKRAWEKALQEELNREFGVTFDF